MPNTPLRYSPILAVCLILAVASSVPFMFNAWLLLLGSIDNGGNGSFGITSLFALILSALSLGGLISLWQFARFRAYAANHQRAWRWWRAYFALSPIPPRSLLPMLTVWLCAIILSSLASTLADEWLGITSKSTGGIAALMDTNTPHRLFAVCVLIIAPVYEELICRGLFWRLGQNIFMVFFSDKKQIVIANSLLISTVFSLLHFGYSSSELLISFAISLSLCYARAKSGSLFAAIILHSLNNALVLIVSIFA